MNTLTVVIGTYNRLGMLKKCIHSIVAKNMINGLKIVVTDAGSTDGTSEYLRLLSAEPESPVQFVAEGKKRGQAKSLNEVFKTLESRYICWLSDDNELRDSILEEGVNIMEKDLEIGLLGLKVKDREGPHKGMDYIGGIWDSGVFTINQGIIRKELFEKLGYLDEDFRDYGIDGDLTTRVLMSGYKVALTRGVGIYHYRNYSEMPGAIGPGKRDEYMKNAIERYRQKFPSLCNWKRGIQKTFLITLAVLCQSLLLKFIGKKPALRDVKVIAKSRFIKYNDLWKMRNRTYYLVQNPIYKRSSK